MTRDTARMATSTDREVCSLVNELSQTINRHVRRAAEKLDLTETQAVALRELTEPTTLRALAKRMCCEASNITFVADRLEAMGLLERKPHPTDRRSKELHLTAKGTSIRRELLKHLNADSPLQSLDQNAQGELRDLLLRATSHS
ncbi:MarR family winged helix-turn-helix transcriptional regulator [Streptomyces sp. NPDC017056]|uniref:MarR family winged helix-turn-helix transcriptional regulator n=1 Tax=Streptomyces sp. NPDC017056 TaxID=3364973 RepID=UPI0037AA2ECD